MFRRNAMFRQEEGRGDDYGRVSETHWVLKAHGTTLL
jgi:hypothetical protein